MHVKFNLRIKEEKNDFLYQKGSLAVFPATIQHISVSLLLIMNNSSLGRVKVEPSTPTEQTKANSSFYWVCLIRGGHSVVFFIKYYKELQQQNKTLQIPANCLNESARVGSMRQ